MYVYMLAIIYTYTYILNAFNSKGRGKTKRETGRVRVYISPCKVRGQ